MHAKGKKHLIAVLDFLQYVLIQHCTCTLEEDLGSTTQHSRLAIDSENTSEARELCLVNHISREKLIDS